MTKIKDLVEKYGNREIDEVELEKILKPVKKTIYDLGNGDEYYSIAISGFVEKAIWNNDFIDKNRLDIGNVFLTYEDVEFEVEYLKVRAELKRYASMCKEPVDWNTDQKKWFINYSYYFVDLEILYTDDRVRDEIYFTDKSILEQAIREIGEERIKKYYLGVKGEDK